MFDKPISLVAEDCLVFTKPSKSSCQRIPNGNEELTVFIDLRILRNVSQTVEYIDIHGRFLRIVNLG